MARKLTAPITYSPTVHAAKIVRTQIAQGFTPAEIIRSLNAQAGAKCVPAGLKAALYAEAAKLR